MRALLVVLLLASTVQAAPDARARFRERNSQHLTALDLDGAGRVRHVRTDDAELTGDDDFTLRGWLQQNADAFGGRAEDNEPRRGAGALAYYLLDDQDQIVGAAIIHRAHGALDVVIVRATRSPDAEAHALIGTRHTQTLRFGRAPQLDCNMGRGSCRTEVLRTQRRTVKLAADEVSAGLQLRTIGGAVRLIVCIDATAEAPDEPDLLSTSLDGLPFGRDATTGARLALASCAQEM